MKVCIHRSSVSLPVGLPGLTAETHDVVVDRMWTVANDHISSTTFHAIILYQPTVLAVLSTDTRFRYLYNTVYEV